MKATILAFVVVSAISLSGCANGGFGCKAAPITGYPMSSIRLIGNDSLMLTTGGQTILLARRQIVDYAFSVRVGNHPLLHELTERIMGEKRFIIYCRDEQQMRRYFPFEI